MDEKADRLKRISDAMVKLALARDAVVCARVALLLAGVQHGGLGDAEEALDRANGTAHCALFNQRQAIYPPGWVA